MRTATKSVMVKRVVLPNTGRYQQWYKVNGDYVLINERTQRIIRIIGLNH